MTADTTETYTLYRFFAADDTLLYVGLTVNPGRRLEKHRDTKTWWGDVARVDGREGDLLITQIYGWWDGSPGSQILFPLSQMRDWAFYDSAEQMQLTLGCSEYFTGTSADQWNGGREGPCRGVATYRTVMGNYVCGRCSEFYSEAVAV